MQRLMIALLLVLPALGLAAAAAAAERRLEASYSVSWAGSEIGRFETELRLDGARYELDYRSRSTGLVGLLVPFESGGRSQGTLDGPTARTERFHAWSRWRDSESAWSVTFGADGRAVAIELPAEERADREPVPASLTVSPDPAALALGAFHLMASARDLQGRSFDGKRVIAHRAECVGIEPVATGAIARELSCTVTSGLVAGASRRWNTPVQRAPTVVRLRALADGLYWPIEVEVDTRFGRVTAVAVDLPD
jgi:hypothetical protein